MPSFEKGVLRAAPRDKKTPETFEDTSIARRHVIDYLGRAQEQSLIQSARWGTPPLDFNRVLTNLKYAEGGDAIPNMVALFDMLFEGGVPPAILRNLNDQIDVDFLEEKDLETHIARRFFGSDVVSEAKPDFRFDKEQRVFGGSKWLGDHVNQQLETRGLDLETAYRVQLLAQQAASRYGTEASAMTRLMYMCGVDEQSLQSIIAARTAEAGKKRVSQGDPGNRNFFEKMQSFVGVYADITTKVARNTDKDKKDEVEVKSKEVLAQFLRSRQFQVSQEGADVSSMDPFKVFGEMLQGEKNLNPWLFGDGKNTPFDVNKFNVLLTPEVPRGLVADAAFFLNNYQEGLFIQKVHQLLNSIEEYEGDYEKKKKERGGSRELSRQLSSKVQEMAAAVLALKEESGPLPEGVTQQRRILEDFSGRQSRGLSAFSVLLRTVDAERVVTNTRTKEEFYALVSGMPRLEVTEENVKKILIFASSVHMFLENTNPHLDVPLLGLEGDPSIRKLLITKSEEKWFDEEILKRGPYAHSTNPNKPPDKSLVTPRDLLGLSAEDLRKATINFNTAKGATWALDRKWINNAGQVMARLPDSYGTILRFTRNQADMHWKNAGEYVTAFHPSASDAMSDIVSNLFPSITNQDYVIGTHEEYDSMVTPFTDKGAQFFAIHCNDREKGRAKTPEEIFHEISMIVEREKGTRGGRLPLSFVISSKTRLGDAIGVVPLEKRLRPKKDKESGEVIEKEVIVGERTPNAFGLAELFEGCRKEYPGSKIITDFSQSVGRNDRGEDLHLLKPDIMIASAGKAPGIKNISVAMIRKTLDSKSENKSTGTGGSDERDYIRVASETPEEYWRRIWSDPLSKLTPGKGTIDTDRIAALGIALQHLNSKIDTWGIRGDGLDIGRKLTQRDLLAEHHARLTSHAIDSASGYALKLLKRLQSSDFPIPIGDPTTLASDSEIRKQFGCQVVYPVHRKKVDYTFVTLTFPNLGTVERKQLELAGGKSKIVPVRGNYLTRSLERNGFPSGYAGEQCMQGGNGLRVSFDALQREEHIDVLFNAIVDAHVALLRRQVEKSAREAGETGDPSMEIKNFDDMRSKTLNVLDEEWIED